jgi:hypothetical protein
MSIESDIATLQTKCSEAERFNQPFSTPAELVRVEVSAAMLRRLIEQARRLMAPKHLPKHLPRDQSGFHETEGQGY